jgi:hypothetical protein
MQNLQPVMNFPVERCPAQPDGRGALVGDFAAHGDRPRHTLATDNPADRRVRARVPANPDATCERAGKASWEPLPVVEPYRFV